MLRWISVTDLISFPDSKKIVLEGDEDKFAELLHDIGFDIEKGYEFEECLHRPMVFKGVDKQPIMGWRIVGTERRDNQWMMSGYASMENRLEKVGEKDVSLLKDMLDMSKQTNFTAMMIDDMKNNSKGNK